ncbi:MAG TPA: RluA family pseudouridine synthase [Thermodesulfovibrionales bacterium]|jgi:23S rRNA pseudouridine1911/1915/1917 synthase|nr:RluA family pseudouridine synthase [Thermodesulfovibrionales bacterium]
MEKKDIIVRPLEAGQRVDTFLASRTGITRSQVQKLIEGGHILINERPGSTNYKVRAYDLVSVRMPEKETKGLIPEPLALEILYKDESIVVVNKPAGMVVYPAAGHDRGTLMNAIAYYCGNLASVGGPLRPGVVHRLDKDTSGVMVVALDDRAYYDLVEQFRRRATRRRYTALVYGALKEEGEIVFPIGRSTSDRKKMSTKTRRGKEAITRWKVLKRYGCATLLEVLLGTGRTHQIRVHFASAGHPLIGDRIYGRRTEIEIGKKKIAVPRQMLHAAMLGFRHPFTEEYMEFSSPLPEDMTAVLESLGSAADASLHMF